MATKAKRRLSNIDFSHEGAHLALCSKSQGAANNYNEALILKASKFSDEFVQKMQQVKVTMELPDFLSKFFHIWGEDAKVLATMMGYKEPVESKEMEDMEAEQEVQDWIKSRMSAFEIIKSAYEAESLSDVLSGLEEEEYLAMLKDQSMIEKAFKKIDKKNQSKESGEVISEVTEQDTSTTASVEKTVEASASEINKGNLMSKELKTVEQEITVEMIEKSAFEAVQKALDEQKVQLEKAMQTIAAFEQEKKEQIVKAKTAKVSAVVKSDKQLSVLLKAGLALEDEDFEKFVGVLSEMQEQIEKSALFVEQGVNADIEEKIENESAVAKILKAQFTK